MPSPPRHFDVIVLGAGAAGLMCAMGAGGRGRRVLLLDHADRPGKKILISGGGRCNFTNLGCTADDFLSGNPHFARSALARYTPADFVALVEAHGIAYHEKARGQLFCDGSAAQIVAMLERECRAAQVQIAPKTPVRGIAREGDTFVVRCASGEHRTPALVVATGGLSIPKMGATGLGYQVARQFGVRVCATRPALVPLTFTEADRAHWCALTGLSVEVDAHCKGQRFRDRMLITHRGLSGPAVLQISSYWSPPEELSIDLAPQHTWTAPLREANAPRTPAAALAALKRVLPQRLAEQWLHTHAPGDWTNRSLDALERQLHAWCVRPADTEGYAKAEVTAGGVDTAELVPSTLECRRVPGLFFIGEVVDVTGHLGGYNFQWAWASGYCAGQAV